MPYTHQLDTSSLTQTLKLLNIIIIVPNTHNTKYMFANNRNSLTLTKTHTQKHHTHTHTLTLFMQTLTQKQRKILGGLVRELRV